MGTDKENVDGIMNEIFGNNVVKVEISMEEIGKITQSILCKTINPETSEDEALEVVKRGRALVLAVSAQEGTVKKSEGSDKESIVYSVDKALVEALIEDIKDVEVSGTWHDNMDALRKRFDKKSDDEGGDDSDDEGDGKPNDEDGKKNTKKNVEKKGKKPELEDEDEIWGSAYDLNKNSTEDEDWGINPAKAKK